VVAYAIKLLYLDVSLTKLLWAQKCI